MPEGTRRPLTVTITLALILLSLITWLLLGILLALNAHPAFPNDASVRTPMAALSVAAGCTLLGLLILLARRRRWAFFVMLACLAFASLSVFFDDVGIADLLMLSIFVAPIALLIKDRGWYLRA